MIRPTLYWYKIISDLTPITEPEKEAVESSSSIFKLLPQTKQNSSLKEVDDEFLHKKATIPITVKQKARITVPSLSDVSTPRDFWDILNLETRSIHLLQVVLIYFYFDENAKF